MKKPLSPDAQYVVEKLFPELEASFRAWSQEYQQERDLGALGEFVGMYRKARKLKTVFIDHIDPSNWRESIRVIALEVAAHALLLVRDLDFAGSNCPAECSEGHTYEPGCAQQIKDESKLHSSVTSSTKPRGVGLGTRIFVRDLNRFEERVPGGWSPVCPRDCDHGADARCVRGLIGKPAA